MRETFPAAELRVLYGPTEATIIATSWEVPADAPVDRTRIGRPLPSVQIRLCDPSGGLVPLGVAGEIWIGGPGVARGYLGRPELTAERFPTVDGQRFYRTGDRARWRPEGEIEFLGRLDDQVKVRGFRIEPGEIEAALVLHPAVRQAVVLAREGRDGSRRLVAWAVPEDGAVAEAEELRAWLAARLPAYMVPAAFVLLPELPRTAHGKVDRRALPEPELARSAADAAPRTPVEETLARIWAEILGLDRVGVDEGFFALGGDSILSIQVVARAARAGLRITPRQMFEHQTIAELATVAGTTDAVTADQGLVTGPVPLTPVQRRFLRSDRTDRSEPTDRSDELLDPHWLTQSLLLAVRGPLAPEVAEGAFTALLSHHDALRLRFAQGESGWHAWTAPPEAAVAAVWEQVDLTALEPAAARAALETLAARTQQSLDLAAGPIVRAVWAELPGDERRLLLVIHHLAVDAVSWRILLEDLETACRQIAAGEPVALPAKTTSFQSWAERLGEHAEALGPEEAAWWQAESAGAADEPEVDHPGGGNLVGSARRITVEMTAEETRALLQDAPAACRAQMQDALLTALARTLAGRAGAVRVELEGHGREEIAPDLDLSRTVGWFTSQYPVRLEAGPADDPLGALCGVKEHLRAVPGHGLGYGLIAFGENAQAETSSPLGGGGLEQGGGQEGGATNGHQPSVSGVVPDGGAPLLTSPLSQPPPSQGGGKDARARLRSAPPPAVGFNYLGQLDTALPAGSFFAPAPEATGPARSPRARREHVLELEAWIAGGRLQAAWLYSADLHREESVARLADRFLGSLREIAAACHAAAEQREARYTPSDFPLARLAQADLDRLLGRRAGIEDLYPLSPLQEGILFHHLYAPGSGVYLGQLTCELQGDLDREAFAAAWQRVVDRHPILRTSFLWSDLDRSLQAVHAQAKAHIEEMDWRGLSPDEQERRMADLLAADRERGLDLATAPVMRWTLARTGQTAWRFLWTQHHILLDGWSHHAVTAELFAAYEALRAGREPQLPRRRPFREHIARLERLDPAPTEAFWRRALAGWSEPTAVVVGRESFDREGSGVRRLWLGTDAAADLQAAARRRQLTLNTLAQGAWALLLARYSAESDVVYGVTVSGRPADLPGVESMLGLFINTLPLRVQVDGAAPLLPWLRDMQRRSAEMRQHEHAPLVRIQGWSEVPRGRALFESILVFENHPRESAVEEGAAGAAASLRATRPAHVERTHYPLTVEVVPGDDVLLQIGWDSSRFDEAAVARMLGHLGQLMLGMTEADDAPLDALPLLTAAERREVLEGWSGTAVPLPHLFVHETLAGWAAREPERTAAVCAGVSLTYRDLHRRAGSLASRLLAAGVMPEEPVAVLADRGLDLLTGLLALLETGGAYLPLDPRYPPARLAQVLRESRAPWLLATTDHASAADAALALLPEGTRPRLLPLDAPIEGTSRRRAGRPALDGLAYVLYTSGSTGVPKGAMVTHRGMLNHLAAKIADLDLGPDDAVAQTASQAFDISIWQLLAALLVGGRVEIFPDETAQSPGLLLAAMAATGITVVETVPSLLRLMIEEAESGAARPPLRWMIPTGEALPPDLCRRWLELFPEIPLLNAYGPTECSDDVTHHAVRSAPPPETTHIPIGRPVLNTCISVLGPGLLPLPQGVAGELCVAGAGVGRGYLHDPRRTAEAFVPDPSALDGGRLYRTGDLARYLPDGALEFLGRIDHQVKVHGFRIELGEIEAALLEQPAVRQAVVLAREDRPGDRRLVAYVVVAPHPPTPSPIPSPQPGEREKNSTALEGEERATAPLSRRLGGDGRGDGGEGLDVGALRDALARRLPQHMVPAAFVTLPELPLTPNGKVDRKALPAPEQPVRDAASPLQAPPRTPAEEVLARVWADVLDRPAVGIHDNFFELGGDSILSIQVVARAARAGWRITPRQLFEHQTVAELAAVAVQGAAPAAAQGAVTGDVPLTPIQRWFFATETIDPHHYNQAVLLALREPLDPAVAERAFALLLRHHDALRLRFAVDGKAWNAAPSPETPWTRLDLSVLPEAAVRETFPIATAEIQASLDLTAGPIVRGAWIDLPGGGARLLLVIHHLAVDGVSWRVLLEDLETACRALAAGRKPELPAKTTSFQAWARRLEEHALSLPADALAAELTWWRREGTGASRHVPVDFPGGDNAQSTQQRLSVWLSAEETQALLQELPAVWRAQMQDALLTALALTLAGPGGALRVDLEGHGREDILEGIDLSRTVGWLTSLYPVRLDLAGTADPGAALRAVKEHLRAVPDHGLGFGLLRWLREEESLAAGVSEVGFNYLGQVDQALPAKSYFAAAPESSGPPQSPRARRAYIFEVGGLVTGGRLRIDWDYSAALHRRETVEHLAAAFRAHLRSLIAACRAALEQQIAAYTPSDFPLARLTAAELTQAVGIEWGIEDIYPLSPLQAGILFHSLYAPGSGVYVDQLLCTLHGPLDAAALAGACRRIVAAHPVLRTSFRWEGLRRPVQVVHGALEIDLREEDWRGLPAAELEQRTEELLRADRAAGFALDRPPLMRWVLARTAEEEHRLLWSYHHVLLDGWSFGVVGGGFLAAYESLRAGQEPRSERRRPYRDYIAWLERQDPAVLEAFWRRTLAGWNEPTPLPERRHPDTSAAGLASLETRLDAGTSALIQEQARRERLTLNTLAQAAWGLLLGRYSGMDDVVFGATVAGRPGDLPGVESMVGLFINTLPVRLRWDDGAHLLAWLGQVQEHLSELRQYEHAPLLDIQGWSEVPRGRGLFDSILVFENYPLDAALTGERKDGSSLRLTEARAVEQTNYPLTAVAVPGREIALRFEVDPARFDAATLERMLGHFRNLLTALAYGLQDGGAQPLGTLAMLTAAERRELLAAGRPTAAFPVEKPLHRLFAEQAARTPRAVAVTCAGEELTYGELDAQADRLARRLRKIGAGPEARIGLCAERSLGLVVGILGILKTGAAYVPLDPEVPAERLAFLLEDSGVRALAAQREVKPRLPAVGVPVVELEDTDEDTDHGTDGDTDFADLGQAAYVIYTSGSTGRPKGVVVSHGQAARLFAAARQGVDFGPGDVWTLFHSYAFDFSVWELWGALAHGGRLVVVPYWVSRSPEAFYALLADEKVTVLSQTPSAFRQLVQADGEAWERGAARTPALRSVIFGGEALDLASLSPWIARRGDDRPRLINMYGITETTVHVTCRRITAEDVAAGTGSVIGEPLPDLGLYVLDPRMEPVPPNVAGELWVGGAGVARGYLGRPDLTAERFLPDPFSGQAGARLYRSGDLARRLPDGDLEYLGRLDRQVKIRGFRIELGEIQAALGAHPAVRDAVVLAREGRDDRRLAAWVVSADPALPPRTEELRAFLADRLPAYMVPATFAVIAALPLTANGKLDRRALLQTDTGAADLGEGAAFLPPAGPEEEMLAEVWARVLDVPRVGAEDNFFALGGDSIRSIQVRSAAEKAGLVFSMQELFLHPTVRSLAREIRRQSAPGEEFAPVPPFGLVREEDRRRLLTLQGRPLSHLPPTPPPGEGRQEETEKSREGVFAFLPSPGDREGGDGRGAGGEGSSAPDSAGSWVEDAYPVASLQAGMLFHSELSPESAVYHDIFSFEMRGRLDLDALETALASLVRRHTALRTGFELSGYSEPLQIVYREAAVPVGFTDLSPLTAEERSAAVAAWVERESTHAFDRRRAPLLRVHVHRLDEGAFRFNLSFHHAILDGWSVASLLTDLFRGYLLLLAGRPLPAEEPPPIGYRDFVAAEQRALASPEARRFWERIVADGPRTRLPRWPAEGVETPAASHREIVLSTEVSDGLRGVARRIGAPLKSVLLAAHLRALSLLTGETEVVTGLVSNGRPEEEGGEKVIGLFLNTVPLRLRLEGGAWADLVSGAFAAERATLPHRRFPLAEVQRMAGGEPPFETVFNYTHFHVHQGLSDLGGLEVVDAGGVEEANYPFAVNFSLAHAEAPVRLRFDRDAEIFGDDQLAAIAACYEQVLTALAAAPEARYDHPAPLPEAARRQVLAAGEGAASPAPARSVHEQLAVWAARTPNAPAILDGDRLVPYGELAAQAGRLARRLARLGVGPEARVGVCFRRSPEMLIGVFGVLGAGGAYLPLDPAYPQERLAFLLADAAPTVLVTNESAAGVLPETGIPTVFLESLGAEDDGPLDRPPVDPAQAVYVIHTSGSTGTPKGVTASHGALAGFTRAVAETIGLGPGDRMLQFASLSFDASALQIFPTLASGAALVLHPNPAELSSDEILALCERQEVTVLDLPGALWRQWVDRMAALGTPLPATIRVYMTGGEKLADETLRKWSRLVREDALFVSSYGPTEATVTTTFFAVTAGEVGGLSTVSSSLGHPLPRTRVRLLDPWLEPVPAGTPGELWIGGANLTRGYLGRPDLTAERFLPDPLAGTEGSEPGARLYRTGDLARWLPDGTVADARGPHPRPLSPLPPTPPPGEGRQEKAEMGQGGALAFLPSPGDREGGAGRGAGGEGTLRLEFLGRADHQVKIRGFRVEPGEIEAALLRHPGVRQVVVVPREDVPGDLRLAAYVVGEGVEAAELREALRAQLPEHMVPAYLVLLPELPVTPNGKVDRAVLPAPSASIAAGPQEDEAAPMTPAEEILAGIVAEVLGVERVGVHDDFFSLGGHSLTATQVVSRSRDAFGVEANLRALFETPTVAGFAAHVESALQAKRGVAAPPLVPALRGGALPLSFAQQRLFFLDRLQPGNPFYNIPTALRFQGRLDLAALAASLDAIVARHEVLRTTFHDTRGVPEQVIAPALSIPVPLVDLSGLPEAERETEAHRVAAAETRRPFDLQRGPLVRLLLVRLGDDEHAGAFTMHHIVSDGWSLGLLVRELTELYTAFTSGRAPQLPALPVQYADFAVWQRQWLDATMDDLVAYWTGQLAGAPPLLALPEARPRPAAQTFRGAVRSRMLPADLARDLNALGRREAATLFVTLLAGLQTLLHIRTGAADLVVGTDMANRNRFETEGLIGFFINQLALRTDLSGDPTFRELLGREREVALGAYAHQDMPFDRLVDALKLPRHLSHAPLFQIKLVLENVPEPRLALPDLRLRPFIVESTTAQLDMNLRANESAAGIGLSLEYSTDLYDAAVIDRFLEQLEEVLRAAAARPDSRLSEIAAALDAAEQKRREEKDRQIEEAGRKKIGRIRRLAPTGS
jgi:amino acid adenylation domain-containing protein/non-ribosomal peptide synthase protein (TIGR01720 family)